MKKWFLSLAALCVAGLASAQSSFTFGPKVGLNISDLYFDAEGIDASDIRGVKTGLLIGAFAEYQFNSWLSVSADVLYSRQGSQSDRFVFDGNPIIGEESWYEFKYSLQYINVPIMANFYVTRGLALKTGIQPSFLVGAKFNVDVDENKQHESESTNIKGDLRTVDLVIPLGLSYTFNNGFFIDARYNFSLSDLMKESTKNALSPEGVEYRKLKNRVVAVTVGWKFGDR